MGIIDIEPWFSKLTRKAVFIPGMWRLIERFRRRSAIQHAGGPDPWVVIEDYDFNLKMRVDRSAFMGSSIYWFGYHAFNELQVLHRLLKPSMVFADLGANQGEFTVFAAKRLREGRVLAFEPVESLYRHLMENVGMNGFQNIMAYDFGLSDRSGVHDIYTSDDWEVHYSLHDGLCTLFPTEQRSKFLGSVQVKVFDEVFESSGLQRLDVMKVDVEGSELPALKGAERTLKKHKPIVFVEVNEQTYQAAGYSTGELTAFLGSLGYSFRLIKAFGRTVPIRSGKFPPFANVMCC